MIGGLHVELRIPEQPAGRKPALLSPVGEPGPLLERGIVLVSFQVDWAYVARTTGAALPPAPPPPAAPGTQVGAWLLAAPRPGIVGRSYFQLIAASASQSVPTVLDLLERVPEIDPARIAISGSSTQGFVALEALRHEPRLAAAVVQVTCGDYLAFLRSSSLALADDPRWLPDGRMELDPDYREELEAHQPIADPDAFPPRPLLMLAGREDRAMPFACVESTAAAFAQAYARAGVPERFALEVFPAAGHDLGPSASDFALRWWERWLLEPASGQ